MTEDSKKASSAKIEQAHQRGCGNCRVMNCDTFAGAYPEICPTREVGGGKSHQETVEIYRGDNLDARIAETAAFVEAENYGRATRVEEIVLFARRMGFKKIGIATCVGLLKESQTVMKVFELHGLAVKMACCKVGAVDKNDIGLPEEAKVYPGQKENICNPIMQARYLNDWPSDFNVLVGLCVGHDSMFFRHAEAPTTVLAVKDRVLGHNPLACIYTSGFYYKRLLDADNKVLKKK